MVRQFRVCLPETRRDSASLTLEADVNYPRRCSAGVSRSPVHPETDVGAARVSLIKTYPGADVCAPSSFCFSVPVYQRKLETVFESLVTVVLIFKP